MYSDSNFLNVFGFGGTKIKRIPSNLEKIVFLFQLSKCIPIPEPGILMYSDFGRNGYRPIDYWEWIGKYTYT